MAKPFTIGVLSPYNVGFYFGGILQGIHAEAKRRGARVLAVRTGDISHRMPYRLALDHADGWVVITELAVHKSYYRILHETGKPIVGIGCDPNALQAPVVVPDNERGMHEAVLHLIAHGHKRIAFAGKPDSPDAVLRLNGYKSALADAGLPFDPSLVYETAENDFAGAVDTGERMLRDGLPFTAFAAATDANAMQIMHALLDAGVSIPARVAVAGFDDHVMSKFFSPSLTSVRQPIERLGEEALHQLFEQHAHGKKPAQRVQIPTVVVKRHSCGCTGEETVQETEEDRRIDRRTILHLNDIITYTQRIGRSLIRANEQEIKNMSWIRGVPYIRWGTFGQWSDAGTEEQDELAVLRPYDANPSLPDSLECRAEQFPPEPYWPESWTAGSEGLITLNPIVSEANEWGVLALYETIDNISHKYDSTAHCFSLLSNALERERLNQERHVRERSYRLLAEQLQIVSRTATDGIWDWDLETDELEINSPLRKMIGFPEEESAITMRTLLGLVHPDDREGLSSRFRAHLNRAAPFFHEFRIRDVRGGYLWVFATAELIRGAERQPIRMIGSFRDISERKSTEERITHLAYHDALTGLPNRMLIYEQLKRAITQADERGHQLAVLLVDLDRFKVVNDSFGHQIGDRLLRHVAEQLDKVAHTGHIVARLSGDEFLIVMPRISEEEQAVELAGRILELLKVPFLDGTHELHMTGSLGISLYPRDGEDQDALIRCADIAMYKAKSEGKNTFAVYDPSMNRMTRERIGMENGLRKALANGEFRLLYQPQINLKTSRLYGVEALLRWESPELGTVSPNDFIPLAEETGLISQIGSWVLEEACRQNKLWQDLGYPPVVMAVNISAHQFNRVGFTEEVKAVLDGTGLHPKWLCLEITESTAIQDMDYSSAMLKELISLGVSVSMDDFGTGFSSLALLKRLPISQVKIDKSFIRDMSEDVDDAAIVNAIIAMSHSLKLLTVAEGVESRQQLSLLKRQGCDAVQGYLISRPTGPGEVARLFLESATDRLYV